MNKSLAVFLINNKVRGINVYYEPPAEGHKPECVMFKTLDQSIKPDDFVAVATSGRLGMTICKVHEVDVEPDFDSSSIMQWIIGVVDPANHEETLKLEAEALVQITKAQTARRRRELRKDMLAEDEAGVKGLGIYQDDSESRREPIRATDQE